MTESKSAWVTGASSGIGLATVERLLACGWQVVGLSRRTPRLDSPLFRATSLDFGDLEALPRRLEESLERFGTPDLAILAAGAGLLGGLEEASWQQIRQLIDLDLTAQIFCARALLPRMKRRGYGDVIFLGSEAALQGRRRGSVYCAAKFGLRGLAQALREECAGSGVRVMIVHPGTVRTPFFDGLEIEPGPGDEHALEAEHVADVLVDLAETPRTAVVDEVVISPRQQQIRRRKRPAP